MFDHGEFGGGIEWFARGGGEPRSVSVGTQKHEEFASQNVNRALAADGVIYVLQGITHMGISEGQLAKIWREHDHFATRVIARYPSEPVDWIRRDDGTWLVATWTAIWETRQGAPSTVLARLPEIISYPTSLNSRGSGPRCESSTQRDPAPQEESEKRSTTHKQRPGAMERANCAFRWLPDRSSNKNRFTAFLVDFGRPAQGRRAGRMRPDPNERAREWRRMLDSGEVANRAELARRAGVSRARVTQVLRRAR